ncbi:MAG: hypothetical protein NTY38_30485, partial [Acidobacteria bacterium]|nr:hypothetical protein [Acidobacteriota bacterium]
MNYRAIVVMLLAVSASALAGGTKPTLRAVDYLDLPAAIESLNPLGAEGVSLAPGETEPLAVVVEAGRALAGVRFDIDGLPKGVSMKLYRITEHSRIVSTRNKRQVTQPYFLEEAAAVELTAGARAVYYLLLKASEAARPGKYSPRIRLAGSTLQVGLEVYPFRLGSADPFFYGAFCAGKDTKITARHLAD